jgi:uncharacterized protein YcbK (DUF882 family)
MESLKLLEHLELGISRRTLLRAGLITALGLGLPNFSFARFPDHQSPEKTLSLYNVHTGEAVHKAVYWAEGEFVPETMQEINYLLRDYRTGDIAPMEPRLFDMFFALRRKLGGTEPFHVISGYRSPETNESLRQVSRGVAKDSLHVQGKAVDVRLPGVELRTLRQAALALRRGGVGYYPSSNFVHLDTGRLRSW